VIQDYNNILVIVAHQDDETIGCGGSIKKWTQEGKQVNVAICTNGDTGIDHSSYYENIVETRNKELSKVKSILGINKITYLNDLIITHSNIDKHRDHRVINEIVTEAVWKSQEDIHPELGKCHIVKDLWCCEITDLLPKVDYVVDITDTFSFKTQAMEVYNSQHNIIKGIRNHLKGTALCRGYMIGEEYGEAFTRISKIPVKI